MVKKKPSPKVTEQQAPAFFTEFADELSALFNKYTKKHSKILQGVLAVVTVKTKEAGYTKVFASGNEMDLDDAVNMVQSFQSASSNASKEVLIRVAQEQLNSKKK